ncbi:MAG: sulfite exporter TauE/SafE family protein [Candidatus Riflebacteria bacterium]|nr:sulfite exporter TauE/SafE family protein [Candidatus Riflebacteria bacterium]
METISLLTIALIMGFVDSALGMMYGTVLSPLLILLNYSSKDVVPAVLISQAIDCFISSYRHHRLKNADFSSGTTDRHIAETVIWFGVFACLVGVYVSNLISPIALNTYIGLLVTVVGIMILLGKSMTLTNSKIYVLGFVSAFNKALSGGGFGPLIAGGQFLFEGRCQKGAIGSADLAKAPICLFSFLLWAFSKGLPPVALFLPLSVGAAIGAYIGPKYLSMTKSREKLTKIVGFLVLLEGTAVLHKVFVK